MPTPPRPSAPPPRPSAPVHPDPNQPTSSAMTITGAPPLPEETPTAEEGAKPVMETGDAEQNAGRTAMELFAKRTKAEQEAGRAAMERYQSRPQLAPNAPAVNIHGVLERR
jgi:hypothetical protein